MDIHKHISKTDWIVCGFILTLFVFRLFFGVDLTDESQYVSQAFLPYMHGSFFVNDLFIQQYLYLFYQPITKIYFSLFGTSGAFLFLRFIFLFQSLFCGWLIYRFSRNTFGTRVALYMGSCLISFIPFSIPSLSYNTVVFQFVPVVASYFLLCDQKSVPLTALVSFMSVFVVCAYPPMLLVVILMMTLHQKWDGAFASIIDLHTKVWIAFAIISTLLSVSLIYFSGFDNFFRSLQFSSLFTSTTLSEKGLALILSFYKPLKYILGFLVIKYFLIKKFKFNGFFEDHRGDLLYLLFVYYVINSKSGSFGSLGHKVVTILFISYFFYLLPKLQFDNRSKFLIVLLVGGGVCGFFSSNGVVNACMTLVVGLVPMLNEGVNLKKGRSIVLPLLLTLLMYSNYKFFYRESPFFNLTSQIPSGSFKGIYTTPERKQILMDIEEDLENLNRNSSQKIFAAYFPAAYTFGLAIPETHMLYFHDARLTPVQVKFATEKMNPRYIVVLKHVNLETTSNLWAQFCRIKSCQEFIKRGNYTIYSRI